MYIFPGLALGAHLGKTGTVTDMMIQTSAEALPELITPEDLRLGYVFPRLSDARWALGHKSRSTEPLASCGFHIYTLNMSIRWHSQYFLFQLAA